MTQTEILNSSKSKTWKMQQLFGLGLTRNQVASLVGVGYGFAHNVYTAMVRGGQQTQSQPRPSESFRLTNFEFNHKFGVEIEGYNIERNELQTELSNANIEVQTESYNHTTRPHWKVVTDSSLSGNRTFELVSPVLEGEAGLRKLKTTTLILKGMEGKVNKTCGLHIHLDARNFDKETWVRLFKNYKKLEGVIDSFMARSRRASNNNFCKTLNKANFETKMDQISRYETTEYVTRSISDYYSERYYKVNIQSFWRHGSIEFRQHQGTMDYKKISNWILFLARLVEFSKVAELESGTWEELNRFLSEDLINYFKQRKQELN